MKKMKKSFSAGHLVLALACIVSFVVFILLTVIANSMVGNLDTQQMDKRWSNTGGVSQISCFFSVNATVTKDRIEEFEHALDAALEEASIVSESTNTNARLWADAYSADGQISVESNLNKITVDAIGIGGDFFLFHPMQLLSGSYFSGNDLMQDYCILDQDAAWKLFGSNDVAGQVVYIGGVAHVVTGVVKQEEGKLYEAAGLDDSQIYVSYDTLEKYGRNNGINHFEIVMPNPVSGYALEYVKKAIGVTESELEVVENSTRFDTLNRIKHIGKLSSRAMNGKAIIYPYWENVARAYEDRVAVMMLFQLIFLVFPVIVISIVLVILWKRRTWTVKSVLLSLRDKIEDILSMRKSRRKRKEPQDDLTL
ncbi:MAG: ABC transporter permease [Lachnospiraceae bacterium]|nr:ABC transporter permease [Lachnospiraceae bacterium]